MNESEKARVYHLFEEGEVTESAARDLLGDDSFRIAEQMTEGTEELLDEDPEMFVSN